MEQNNQQEIRQYYKHHAMLYDATRWEEALDRAQEEMAENGRIAVVDFHRSSFSWFTKWMGINHVRMDGHLSEALHQRFDPVFTRKIAVFGGLWEYFVFIGQKKK